MVSWNSYCRRSEGFEPMSRPAPMDCRPAVALPRRRSPGGATVLAVLSIAISGCAVGPNFNPAAVPDVNGYVPGKLASPNPGGGPPAVVGQRFISGADVSARWWAAFKSQPLNDLVKRSVEQNPNLQAAEAAIKIARYNALAQRGLFAPQLTGNSTSQQILVANPQQVPSRVWMP